MTCTGVLMSGAGPEPNAGEVTFLFTDIEGSTRRWEADPEAMRLDLAIHDSLLRRIVADHDGMTFKHTGDGICAAFTSPRAAVDAAVSAQRALQLPVRMGIATGEAEERGGDYFGPVLNRTARIMGAGHGGQILVDGITARHLHATTRPCDLRDLGARRLRDIAKPVGLFQVCAPGLRLDFPALKTVDPTVGNLRRPTTSFIGRAAEAVALLAAIKANRLMTLTGFGGVGKTRLALEVAARAATDYPDGVWVIELASVSDPSAVPDAVSAVLGITAQPGLTVTQSIAATMAGRSSLLLFDNCEHVLDSAADLVATILAASTTVHVLATSREGLHLYDEQLWPVPGLDTDTGTDCAAATLFLERASAGTPGLAIDAMEAAAVVDICRHLDGIPLAIELAASRTLSMTVTEIRDRLDDRFRLLVGSVRGDARHHTLHNAVQWSYDLLGDTEKRMLECCSVFAGGFDLEAAVAVGRAGDTYATLGALDSLVRKSLVTVHQSERRTRYSMLETIRQFAGENLASSGDADDARAAHAHHFAHCDAQMIATWDSPRQRSAYRWLAVELANLRTAFRWASDHDDIDTAAAIAVCAGFLGGWIELHEPSTWAEELVERARTVKHPRLAQLCVAASECYRTGRVDDAFAYAEESVGLIESGRYEPITYDIEPTALGGVYITKGLSDRWVELCRNTLARERGHNLYNRGSLVIALLTAGKSDEAASASEELLAAAASVDNPGAAAYALLAYGYAHHAALRPDTYDALRRGLDIAQASGNRMTESYLAVNLSVFTAINGATVETLDLLALALHNFYDSGSYSHMVSPLAVLATQLDRIGQYDAATTLIGFSVSEMTLATFPEMATTVRHLREVLGDPHYEALAHAGTSMTNAGIAQFAFEQIDRALSQL
jgi:predicted ATPase/class 3 adenylate cyclase